MPIATKSSVAKKAPKKTSHRTLGVKGAGVGKKSEITENSNAEPVKNSSNDAGNQKVQEAASVEPVLQNIPVWDSWNVRHTLTLSDAICTVHNIIANERVLKKLRKDRDPRAKGAKTHLKTLKDWVRMEPDVLPVEERYKGRPVTKSTSILLVPFIQWVKETNPFPGLEIPSQFFELNPPEKKPPQAKAMQGVTSHGEEHSNASDKTDDAQHKKWVKLLIALAMMDYDLKPKLPAKGLMEHSRGKKAKGLYRPLAKYCKDHGIDRLSVGSVKEAFEDAVEFLGQDFVDRLQTYAEGKDKAAQVKKAVQEAEKLQSKPAANV